MELKDIEESIFSYGCSTSTVVGYWKNIDKENRLIRELKEEVSDLDLTVEQRSNEELKKWLQARDWNVREAGIMLRKHLNFRQDNDIDGILSWKPPTHFKCKFEISGLDNYGCPIVVVPYGEWGVREVVEGGDGEVLIRLIDFMFAKAYKKMRKVSEKLGKIVNKIILIGDLDGFHMKQLTHFASVDVVMRIVRRYEENYPLIFKKCFVVNAPRAFRIFYNMLKPLVSAETAEKIQIFGTDKEKWEKCLLEEIEWDQLPLRLKGPQKISAENLQNSTTIPELVLESKNEENEMISCTVDVGEKLEVQLDVKYPSSVLTWSFKTEDFDIGFSIMYENYEEILPFKRCDSHEELHEGSILCEKAGKYNVFFDNSCNHIWSKKLYCLVTVKNPTGLKDEDED